MITNQSAATATTLDLSLEKFEFCKVAVVLTGSTMTQIMPFWMDWVREAAPNTEFRVIMRESAKRFATKHGFEARMRTRVQQDEWSDEVIAAHIELAEWADLILIYPATLDYISRLANGITDSPSLLAALTTNAPVCIAPALPPRAMNNEIVRGTLEKLRAPSNFMVIDPVPGNSESSEVTHAWVPPAFPDVLRKIEAFRSEHAEVKSEPVAT
ncbi:hypothetical protein AUR04nite_34130 [Glutamicibacter uratoxydans]|uniref:Flavoprotein domain-containing protein n=1 Tax=Glutamicibacter uratoxydans TaxID=43667 RepID=A0A4Y4DZV3_GLUUR|nr:flavoprotein [Glutamicibacter uratoxydans]GED07881.1 hypothetical protein AUR04nite_34130 [Glutamicibacter uratoxydans]